MLERPFTHLFLRGVTISDFFPLSKSNLPAFDIGSNNPSVKENETV